MRCDRVRRSALERPGDGDERHCSRERRADGRARSHGSRPGGIGGARDTHVVHWCDGSTGGALDASYRYDDNGTYVSVTVRADYGGVRTDSLTVTVRNVAPAVDTAPDASAYWGIAVLFRGVATVPSEVDRRAGFDSRWSFGGGASAGGLETTHAYDAPGEFSAVLIARDKDGGIGSDERRVMVRRRETGLTYAGPATAVFGGGTLSPLLPGEHVVALGFAGDLHYLASSAQAPPGR